jgi:Tfp pilus assembly protein PilP
LKLAGIAEDAGAEGPVRTAIISGEGQLYMAKEGDNVTPRYRVVRISPDVVELLDVIDNSTRRLALR